VVGRVDNDTTGGELRKELKVMFKTILLAIDGSPLAARAVPYAQRLGRIDTARLVPVRAHLLTDDSLSADR
jgi:hypothetical protein